MRKRLGHLAPWWAGSALVAAAVGVIVAPSATLAGLAVLGVCMLARLAVAAARLIGARATVARLLIGASLGPWLALADPNLATAAALEIAVVAALTVVASAGYAHRWRQGPLEYVGVSSRRRTAP